MTQETELLIIGAGFSGLCMAMEARKRGFSDITILEKADDIGGTWRENTYPGVACDIPSHLYSFANHLNPDWSTCYAGGAEIWDYMRDVARKEGLYELCHFGQKMQSARWDGTRWQVTTDSGQIWSARVLVSGIGALHIPSIPQIPGASEFSGPAFHSAQWRHDVDLTGKRVAVVGTGASAVQFIPEIARTAAHVTVFQRTAPYVLPRPDGPIAPWLRRLYHHLPILKRLRRAAIFEVFEFRHRMFTGTPWLVNLAMKEWRKRMESAISDPEMRAALTPPYRIGCKRVLSSNDWYKTLARDNVTLIPEGVSEIAGSQLCTARGQQVEADVLVWGTGFEVTEALGYLDITGTDGLALTEAWAGGIKAHLGTAIAGFPNLFFLLGPHTGLGHNSVVLMIEAQVAHLGALLDRMRSDGISAVEPRPEAQEAFVAEMAQSLKGTAWRDGGCASWYQDAEGGLPTLWPGTVRAYQRRMARSGLEQYRPAATVQG